MAKRHEKLGIKQTIQITWMNQTVQMILAGMPASEIRKNLDHFLSTQKQSGGAGERGGKTYGMALGILASWFAPDKNLISFRDSVLECARTLPSNQWLPLHWSIISASYPFWWNVAMQVGRLLNLQDQVTQPQIFDRIKEQYGDRETVARNARYAVRSFVGWGVLKDTDTRGSYKKAVPVSVYDQKCATLMFEAALYANPEGKGALGLLMNNPAFFPFQLPAMTGDIISQNGDRIDVVRYGLDDEFLILSEYQP